MAWEGTCVVLAGKLARACFRTRRTIGACAASALACMPATVALLGAPLLAHEGGATQAAFGCLVACAANAGGNHARTARPSVAGAHAFVLVAGQKLDDIIAKHQMRLLPANLAAHASARRYVLSARQHAADRPARARSLARSGARTTFPAVAHLPQPSYRL